MIGMWKIAPALACGCTLVVKPADLTPLSMLRVAELFLEAGLPPGAFNVVCGKGSVVGEALVQHPAVDKVTFTGSPKVGRGMHARCGRQLQEGHARAGRKIRQCHLLRCEPGARCGLPRRSGIFFNAGQVCRRGSRVLVPKAGFYDEMMIALPRALAPFASATQRPKGRPWVP